MGSDDPHSYTDDGEGPVHEVVIPPFRIDRCAVSNERFVAFVDAMGYRTDAERVGWSFVFGGLLPDAFPVTRGVADAPWWRVVEGADWQHPEGPQSGLGGRARHPVIHVSWHDAMAFCKWAGARLPTEAEWECAARGTLTACHFPWGHEREPGGRHRMNVFQGSFPDLDTGADGHVGLCPVDAFEPNGFGLHNITGNAWEWCADWFDPTYYSNSPRHDPRGPSTGAVKVLRGGSYLCHESYCWRYRVDARSGNTPDSFSGNISFRVAGDAADAVPATSEHLD